MKALHSDVPAEYVKRLPSSGQPPYLAWQDCFRIASRRLARIGVKWETRIISFNISPENDVATVHMRLTLTGENYRLSIEEIAQSKGNQNAPAIEIATRSCTKRAFATLGLDANR